MERGPSVTAVQPDPGGLRPALLTVSGLQVSRLGHLSLLAISRKTAKGCTCGVATVTATAVTLKFDSAENSQYRGYRTNADLTGRGQTAGV